MFREFLPSLQRSANFHEQRHVIFPGISLSSSNSFKILSTSEFFVSHGRSGSVIVPSVFFVSDDQNLLEIVSDASRARSGKLQSKTDMKETVKIRRSCKIGTIISSSLNLPLNKIVANLNLPNDTLFWFK